MLNQNVCACSSFKPANSVIHLWFSSKWVISVYSLKHKFNFFIDKACHVTAHYSKGNVFVHSHPSLRFMICLISAPSLVFVIIIWFLVLCFLQGFLVLKCIWLLSQLSSLSANMPLSYACQTCHHSQLWPEQRRTSRQQILTWKLKNTSWHWHLLKSTLLNSLHTLLWPLILVCLFLYLSRIISYQASSAISGFPQNTHSSKGSLV